MNDSEFIHRITSKKEFSDLPIEDVLVAFSNFNKEKYSDEEKVKLTRDLLRKTFSVFASGKTFSLNHLKKRDESWMLRKHISTRERLSNYKEVYSKIFYGVKEKEISIVDLGAGINGLSLGFFPKDKKINYLAIEGVGQLVELMNSYFISKNIKNAKAEKKSLFDIEGTFSLIKKQKEPRIIFLFKVIDSLEMLKRDYSKELLLRLKPLSSRLIVSFATRSLVSRKKFYVNRNWIFSFINENFSILEDFEIGGERYLIIEGKDK